jgi:acetyl-CoA/propionyl-CoA carboxylase biotin carboxyl carrier protein
VDSGFWEGDEVPRAYDSLVAKLVAWAPTREEARRRALRALAEFEIEGIPTTIPAHRLLLERREFVDGSYTTRSVDGGALDALIEKTVQSPTDTSSPAVLMVDATPVRLWHPAIAGSVSGAVRGGTRAGGGQVVAPMHGTILKILVAEGDRIEAGDPVAILEAMKMETHIPAAGAGLVRAITVRPGEIVEAGQPIAQVG